MLLPQTKEREYRFKLALRMGLPIFALIIAFVSHTLISTYETLQTSFFIEAGLLVLVSIYFIFHLIYHGFKVKITDDVSNTFTREYLYQYLKNEIKNNKNYTLVLISIDNLHDINSVYGIKNGDKVLKDVISWVASYLEKNGIENFPIGHIKGGDFIIGLEGDEDKYYNILELMYIKASDFKVDDIEVKICGSIVDTSYSKELDYLIENLFDKKSKDEDENINPNELEQLVINSLKQKSLVAKFQDVFDKKSNVVFSESFIKIKTLDKKVLYPKTYMKIINKFGLTVEFDLMVLEYLAKNYHDKKNYLSVNISPTSLRNDKFLSSFKEMLLKYDLKIIFILSEMQYYSHIEKYKTILSSLQKDGVKFVIDRVGSWHTSFLYLRELDIDMIRYDTYYSNSIKLKQNINILNGFDEMAHEKGVKTWIKNIEDKDSYELVQSLDIDFIQGRYLSELEKKELK